MELSRELREMARCLVLHYLNGGTIEEAIASGREGGLPDELLDSFPGMMFRATAGASAVHGGWWSFDQVIRKLAREGAPPEDARMLVTTALELINELAAAGGEDRPVPKPDTKWFESVQ